MVVRERLFRHRSWRPGITTRDPWRPAGSFGRDGARRRTGPGSARRGVGSGGSNPSGSRHGRSSDDRAWVERFGVRHLTVFNDSSEPRKATIAPDVVKTGEGRESVQGRAAAWRGAGSTWNWNRRDGRRWRSP